jgi:hypothetical protein
MPFLLVVLRTRWLINLRTIYNNYNDLFMRFKVEGNAYELNGLKYPLSQMINVHRLENLLVVELLLDFIVWKTRGW